MTAQQWPIRLLQFFLIFTLMGCSPLASDDEFGADRPEEVPTEANLIDAEPLDHRDDQIEATLSPPTPSSTNYMEIAPDADAASSNQSSARAIDTDGVDVAKIDLDEDLAKGVFDSQFSWNDCPFRSRDAERYGVRCGTLTVQENRRVLQNKFIHLAVAILPAANSNRPVTIDALAESDPIIFLDGGPGGSALLSLESEVEGWASYGFAQERPLIFIDQRGTGYSQPDLNCEELDAEDGTESELAQRCRDRLAAEGIDLSAYNTAENGADVADLVRLLGLQSYNLLGVSYGTRLALVIMRDHPQKLRSVVLDSPFPPNADPAKEEAALTYDRMRALFELCAAEIACNAQFPDLENIFLDTVDRLNFETAEGSLFSDPIDGEYLTSVVSRGLFAADEYLFLLPLMIYDAYEGDYTLLQEIGGELLGYQRRVGARQTVYQTENEENDGDSEGMYYSVMCRDEIPFSNYTEAETHTLANVPAEVADNLFLPTVQTFNVCDIWGSGTALPLEERAVSSNIPTLILAGEFDPATPPQWGRLAAETLPNSLYYEIPGAGHSLSSVNDCAIELIDRFFVNPTGPLDDGCIAAIEPVFFELR